MTREAVHYQRQQVVGLGLKLFDRLQPGLDHVEAEQNHSTSNNCGPSGNVTQYLGSLYPVRSARNPSARQKAKPTATPQPNSRETPVTKNLQKNAKATSKATQTA